METSNHSMHNSLMSYNNLDSNNDGFDTFLDGAQSAADSIDYNSQFDPALFQSHDLTSSHNDAPPSNQQPQTTSTQPRPQALQQQAPPPNSLLQQFKSNVPTYNNYQYAPTTLGQSLHDQRASASPLNPSLLARPTPSPGAYSQYPFQQSSNQQPMNYGQQSFNPQFNSFDQQRHRSSPTPLQMFRSQGTSQMPGYMNAPQALQRPQGIQPQSTHPNHYPYQLSQGFVNPSLLNGGSYLNSHELQGFKPSTTPYYAKPGSVDPRFLLQQQQQQTPLYPDQDRMQQNTPMSMQQNYNTAYPQYLSTIQPLTRPQVANVTNGHGGQVVQAGDKKSSRKGPSGSASTDDDLEIEEEPEVRPAMLSISKPQDERGKVLYEVIDAVWTPRNKPAAPEKVRSGVQVVGDSLRMLRDQWKAQNERLKKAELPQSDTASQAQELKSKTNMYREIMETLVGRITRFGHPSILRRLGENAFTLSALYSFLLDRVNADDYNSTLITAILELGTKLDIDEENLERVKWTKILVRISKKSTTASKEHALRILDNAKQTTARKAAEASGQGPASPSGSASGRNVAPVAGVKRPRDGSETIQQSKKATVRPSSKPLSLQVAEQRRLKEKAAAAAAAKDAKLSKSGVNGVATAPPVNKMKSATVVPKISPFASLLSAGKKPGTSNAERVAAAAVSKDKIETLQTAQSLPVTADVKDEALPKVEPPSSVPKTLSTAVPAASFLGFLADMDKPKPAPTKQANVDPSESPRAQEKRRRRQARGNLRVSWKPEGELLQVKVFEHHPDEDTGHEDSMMRDAGDTVKEGEMLKRHVDVDEDEDDEDDEFYFCPSEVVTDIEALEGFPIYVKTGGTELPESESRAAQDKYEAERLMTMYARGEQPNSPTEPMNDEDNEEFKPCLDLGEPTDSRIRQREQSFLSHAQPQQPAQAANTNLSAIIAALSQGQTQSLPTSQLVPTSQQSYPNGYTAFPPPPPPPGMLQNGINGVSLGALFSAPNPSPSSALPLPPPLLQLAQPTAPTLTPDLQAFLANLGQNGLQPVPQQYPSSVNNANTLALGSGGNPNPFPGTVGGGLEVDGQMNSYTGNKKEKKKGSKAPIDEATGLPLNYKTQVCTFWREGKCTKGDACTYKHEIE